jgi:hypothetical protein
VVPRATNVPEWVVLQFAPKIADSGDGNTALRAATSTTCCARARPARHHHPVFPDVDYVDEPPRSAFWPGSGRPEREAATPARFPALERLIFSRRSGDPKARKTRRRTYVDQ